VITTRCGEESESEYGTGPICTAVLVKALCPLIRNSLKLFQFIFVKMNNENLLFNIHDYFNSEQERKETSTGKELNLRHNHLLHPSFASPGPLPPSCCNDLSADF